MWHTMLSDVAQSFMCFHTQSMHVVLIHPYVSQCSVGGCSYIHSETAECINRAARTRGHGIGRTPATGELNLWFGREACVNVR